ncbi:MAG TPA: pyrroline-5-carboxylate reductase [Candidatus Omnitrophota bacterium]|nr:pyrroline-5-carboxylate reductase [Candidatus Omnitrophota bacterium]
MKQKIGFIGAGNMGSAILEGVLKKKIVSASHIIVYDKIAAKSQMLSKRFHVARADCIGDVFRESDVVLLAIKPQDFKEFAAETRDLIRQGQWIVSILAGLSVDRIREEMGRVDVVRAMPNLGAKVGQSMTVITGSKKRLALAEKIFQGCGDVVRLPEKCFDDVTAVSGSGPAYFFYLMELMSEFALRKGFPADVATRLAIQTGLGAVLVAKNSEVSCSQLRKMVTSRKGTTEAALTVLQRRKFGRIFQSALVAASKRSRQLRK